MPECDGIKAAKRLRGLPDPHVLRPLLAPPAWQKAIKAGAAGFTVKIDAPKEIITRSIKACRGEPQNRLTSRIQIAAVFLSSGVNGRDVQLTIRTVPI